ncbi:TonB-dependent receptor, partial [Bacillus sp. SIMBA_154]|uniref:TonB-dependent receptor domain-containing protein n=1 Tax=Bacillus sp. SIMBA_154 TaxID=3080859 RepID=UPI0039783680
HRYALPRVCRRPWSWSYQQPACITDEPFEPTTADQLEAGIKYLSPDRATKGTFAVFDITQKNVVVSDYVNYRSQTQTGEI